jgi:uncharacterized protein
VTQALRIAGTLLLALAAALGCVWAGTPLPWMIGPLLATAAVSMAGVPLQAPAVMRHAGQGAIGLSLGLYFTPAVVAVLLSLLPALALGVAWSLLMGYGFYRLLWWRHGGEPGVGRSTAFFAAGIGGASEMALLAERHGGRIDRVAASHSLRIVLVVLTIPFAMKALGVHGADPALPGMLEVRPGGLALLVALSLAGAVLLRRLQGPSPWVLGPLLVAMVLTASDVQLSALPKVATNFGQLFIGIALGTRFTPDFARAAPRWLATVAFGSLAMMGASALFGWGLARLLGLHPATMVLATAPGGIAEMSITAKVLQLGVPVVTVFQLVRYLAVLVLTGPMFRLELARLRRRR